jgi:uncharacterized membrane protein YuzA (DUF378 family)
MNFEGIIIGAAAFLLIGLFHPLVIKAEYHFGVKIWWAFVLLGFVFCGISLFAKNSIINIITAIAGFCCFWSILELFHQKKRVEKGWFPKKPQ